MERRLTAILAADVVGYSRLMGVDEPGTLATLKAHREELIDPKITEHGGRTVKLMGDGILVEFPSVVEAVNCAVELQALIAERNSELPDNRQMRYRIGINLGDVMVDDGDIYGDGVNVAARLQELAEPGGICISDRVHADVRDRLKYGFDDLGERQVKNIARPIHVYRVSAEPTAKAGPARTSKPSGIRLGLAALVTATFVALIVAVAAGWYLYQRPHAFEPEFDKPSIAVLPFTNMSGDPEQDYFSDGIAEDIITDLSKISGLFVIARNSSFTYKGKATDINQIGRELGVRYVLEGSVQRAGEQVRINAQLIDATTGGHLWAERYDGGLQDIFALQDKVASKVASALSLEFASPEQRQVGRRGSSVPKAYDDYMRARRLFNSRNWWETVEKDRARELVREALARDPAFAEAYVLLGEIKLFECCWRGTLGSGFFASSEPLELARKALSLSESAEAYALLGKSHLYSDFDHEAALQAAGAALRLAPNNADVLADAAAVLVMSGKPDKALELIAQAKRINPAFPIRYHRTTGFGYLFLGKFRLAADEFRILYDNEPLPIDTALLLASSLALSGAEEEARAAIADYRKRQPNETAFAAGYRFKHLRREQDRQRIVDGLRLAGMPE